MRRTNEAFKEEVFRRSREYKRKQARHRKQLLTISCCLVLAVGLFLLNPPGADKIAMDTNEAAAMGVAPESPMEMAPAAPMAPDMAPESEQVNEPAPDVPQGLSELKRTTDSITALMSPEDSALLKRLLEDVQWLDTMANCAPDYEFTLDGQAFHYHADCGTLQNYATGRCATLDEDQQAALNAIIEVYFPAD